MKRKLLRCMTAVATMLLATSCSSELVLEGAPNNGVDGEEVEVTFSISAENAHAMRAAEDGEPGGPGRKQTVGKAQNIDMLIYAVYEYSESDKKYKLLDQYGKGLYDNGNGAFERTEKAAIAMKTDESLNDQTIINVGETLSSGGAEKITLRLMRNKEYHIAFWAQSSETTAYNTDDLEKVQVIYENAANNDELRDAFCKVESFSVTPSASSDDNRTVILTRPLAQINVGTTGADYKYVVNRLDRRFTQSQIELSGVAQFFDVVRDNVITTDENDESLLTNATFKFAKIPAFKYPADYTPQVKTKESDGGEDIYDYSDFYRDRKGEEEYLYVDLNNDGEFKDYKLTYPTLNPLYKDNGEFDSDAEAPDNDSYTQEDGYFLTETFKYLSMCYVLVPATPAEEINKGNENVAQFNSSILSGVTVTIAETNADDGTPDKKYKSVDLKNVPVHRNWRTNILCGLYKEDITVPEDPNTPEDEDEDEDPTSIYKTPYVLLYLNPNYYDDYAGEKGDKNEDDGNYWNWQWLFGNGN